MATPAARRISFTAEDISGPTPSPGIKVMVCLIVIGSVYMESRPSCSPVVQEQFRCHHSVFASKREPWAAFSESDIISLQVGAHGTRLGAFWRIAEWFN